MSLRIYVAYNRYGDLVAEAYSYFALEKSVAWAGYSMDEVLVGTVTP